MKTPSRMLIGVWNAHDSAMIRNVTHRACGRPGSDSTARQLTSPVKWIAPRPSQDVKLRTRTPTSGTSANNTKNASAGSASQLNDRCRLRGDAGVCTDAVC